MSVPSDHPDTLLRFGLFEVDLGSGEIRKQGRRIHLREQPFRVLVALLKQPGHLVSREDLQSQLWPSDTFVDFDNSLNACINKLREALGDSADGPRWIETVRVADIALSVSWRGSKVIQHPRGMDPRSARLRS
jgi:eukaryotic-like serine/threonine-protein kinase